MKIIVGILLSLFGVVGVLASVWGGAILRHNVEPYLQEAATSSMIICGIFFTLVGVGGIIVVTEANLED